MVAATYDLAIAKVFQDEGGYTNHPNDPGGPTNWGITINDARMYWKPDATAADVKAMPKSVAERIYRTKYAAPVLYDQLPAGMDYSVLDAGINSGIGRAVPWLCATLGLKAGTKIAGLVGPASMTPDKTKLIKAYWARRLSFLHSLRTWSTFGKGWGRRVATGEALAVKLWLQFGAALAPADVSAKLKDEAKSATTKKNASATTAGASGSGAAATPTAQPPGMWDSLPTSGKVAVVLIGIALVGVAIYFIQRAIIHSQRATAYTEAAGA